MNTNSQLEKFIPNETTEMTALNDSPIESTRVDQNDSSLETEIDFPNLQKREENDVIKNVDNRVVDMNVILDLVKKQEKEKPELGRKDPTDWDIKYLRKTISDSYCLSLFSFGFTIAFFAMTMVMAFFWIRSLSAAHDNLRQLESGKAVPILFKVMSPVVDERNAHNFSPGISSNSASPQNARQIYLQPIIQEDTEYEQTSAGPQLEDAAVRPANYIRENEDEGEFEETFPPSPAQGLIAGTPAPVKTRETYDKYDFLNY